MRVELRDNELALFLPLGEPTPSKSGKSMIVASTRGNQPTDEKVNGETLIVSVNAYTKK